MLSKFEVTSRRGTILSFPMEENDGGYQVAEIEGLEPVKANLVSTSFAGMPGEQYQSAKREPRNIKIKFDLEPDFVNDTYTTLRQRLYSYFMPQSKVKLRFYQTTGLYVDIDAVVEDFPAALFSEMPDVEVSLMCFQPDFIDPRRVIKPGFSTSGNEPTIIQYPGNIDTDTVITLMPERTVSDFSVYNTDETGFTSRLDFSMELVAGDVLVISSLQGNKGITLTRDGVGKSVLYGRTSQSSWIQLSEGENQFRIFATGDPIPYVLEYVVRYGGL